MWNGLMAIVQGDGSSWAGQKHSPNNFYFDNFGEPALYALIGLLVVFVGIVLIIGIIWLVGLIMRKTDNLAFLSKKREKKPKQEQKPQASEVAKADGADGDDIPAEVKAAIVAAIMAYYSQSEEKCNFTVKRIKRL